MSGIRLKSVAAQSNALPLTTEYLIAAVKLIETKEDEVELIRSNFGLVRLTNGGYSLIDPADYAKVNAYLWHEQAGGYAVSFSSPLRGMLLHRFIMDPPPKTHVDHISGARLDNRRVNLRVCTARQNQQNRGSARHTFKGINRMRDKWQAKITVDGKQIHLGTFDTEIQAGQAYADAARKYFGPFARILGGL